MIEYAERVEEVVNIVRSQFGFSDVGAIEIILAATMPCGVRPPWLIFETDYYKLEMDGAWFALLGGVGGACTALPAIRTQRPRQANAQVKELLNLREYPHLFIESNWHQPISIVYQFQMWPYLLQECLVIRAGQPKAALPDDRARLQLAEAVRRVFDSQWRSAMAVAPVPPPSLFHYAETLQKLSFRLRDWDCLLSNLTSLVRRRAYLFNRPVDETDWEAVSRVMRDSVPAWVAALVKAYERPGKMYKLSGWYAVTTVRTELRRLVSQGVLQHNRGDWFIRDTEGARQSILDVIEGLTF